MKWLDIAVIVLTIGYCAYIVFARKKHGCCGNCSGCQGCNHKNSRREWDEATN